MYKTVEITKVENGYILEKGDALNTTKVYLDFADLLHDVAWFFNEEGIREKIKAWTSLPEGETRITQEIPPKNQGG